MEESTEIASVGYYGCELFGLGGEVIFRSAGNYILAFSRIILDVLVLEAKSPWSAGGY
jgi:hypothetical protein